MSKNRFIAILLIGTFLITGAGCASSVSNQNKDSDAQKQTYEEKKAENPIPEISEDSTKDDYDNLVEGVEGLVNDLEGMNESVNDLENVNTNLQ